MLEARAPTLSVVRLTGEEVEFRPLPLLGDLSETSGAAVARAVGVRQSGPFNSFTLTAESAGQEFVVSSIERGTFFPCFEEAYLPCADCLLSLSSALLKRILHPFASLTVFQSCDLALLENHSGQPGKVNCFQHAIKVIFQILKKF